MKILPAMLAVGWLTAASCAWAQDDPHAGHQPPVVGQPANDAAGQTEGHDQAADSSEHEHGKAGGKLQENLKRMQALMARMRETTDAAQRRALLGEHLQLMREQLKLMLAQAGGHEHGSKAGADAPDTGQEAHGAQPNQGSDAGDQKKMCAMMEGGKCKMMENEKNGGMTAGGMMTGEMMSGGMMMMHKKMEQRVQMLEQLLGQMVEREAIVDGLESR
jgi:hypothetical protein